MKLVYALLLIVLANQADAAPITFNTALPVSKNQLIVREQLISSKNSDDEARLTQTSLVTTLVYGATAKTTLFATIPLHYRSLDNSQTNTSESGLGDSQLFVRHTIYKRDKSGTTFRIAPFTGIKLATGKTGTALALGSGSTDFFSGIALTYGTTDWTIDGQLQYQNNGRFEQQRLGDTISFDASLQYRFYPRVLSANTSAFFNGVIEFNAIHQGATRINQQGVDNTGGNTFFISPGAQYISQNWIGEASVQIPLSDNTQVLESDYVARIGVRVIF